MFKKNRREREGRDNPKCPFPSFACFDGQESRNRLKFRRKGKAHDRKSRSPKCDITFKLIVHNLCSPFVAPAYVKTASYQNGLIQRFLPRENTIDVEPRDRSHAHAGHRRCRHGHHSHRGHRRYRNHHPGRRGGRRCRSRTAWTPVGGRIERVPDGAMIVQGDWHALRMRCAGSQGPSKRERAHAKNELRKVHLT